jgi:putative peptide zinc metalloprotease protein
MHGLLLREELALLPGPVLPDGQPSHTLHDPVRNLFFQIDWPTFEVLRRWRLGNPALIAAAISRETTLQLEPKDVEDVIAFFHENQLLQPQPGAAAKYAARLRDRRSNIGKQLLHNYLFFRIPLIKPDRWLGRCSSSLDFFYSRRFLYLTLIALCWGLVEAYRQWDRFSATLVDTLSWSGLANYGVTLVMVKILHEFGHAFTAKRQGCKVPTMGIAFMVLWPVAYTDVNEVWKLTDRRQRLAVAAAGVLTELAIAAWATLAWAMAPEGAIKSMAFFLATTSWIATVMINISPFMRFDGYFLLSDWLGMPNLHARSFALARWHIREGLFALGAPPPESFSPHKQAGLILFAYATWIYRLIVFLGIACLVYAFFIKAVGIFLFAVEIVWFVLLPVYKELQIWRAALPILRRHPRAWRSTGILLVLILLLALPWPSRLTASALLRPVEQFVIYAPPNAQVEALPIAEGQRVTAGATLMKLTSPDLAGRRSSAVAQVESLRWQASAGAFDKEQRAQWQVSQEQLSAAEAELATVQADEMRYEPTAPFAGVLRDLPPDLRPRTWVTTDEPLARLIGDQGQTVVAYLSEEEVGHVSPGDAAKFYADAAGGPVVSLEVVSIDADASRVLSEPELATLFGGGIMAREKNGQFYPEQPVYRVTLKVSDAEAVERAGQHTWRGKVVISGRWASPGWRYLRAAMAVVRREAGF